jgi:hypothetical protein
MSEPLNYARHMGDRKRRVVATKTLVMFRGTPPIPQGEWHEWAFWRIPNGIYPEDFTGRLVAECSDNRCIRTRHKLKMCARCQGGGAWNDWPKKVAKCGDE